MAHRAPYGTWRSPIGAADLAQSAISLDDVQVVDGVPYWIESRPAERGRQVIVTPAEPIGAAGIRSARAGASARPLESVGVIERTPSGFNARTRVHEYGGRPYTIRRDGTIFFSHFADQRVYAQAADAAPFPLTPPGYRYADFALDPSGARLFCVREDHSGAGEPKNAIVALAVPSSSSAKTSGPPVQQTFGSAPSAADAVGAAAGATPGTAEAAAEIAVGVAAAMGATAAAPAAAAMGAASSPAAGTILYGDSDFVAFPRVSPEGRRLAWISWNHPNMPWDATTLHVAELTGEGVERTQQVAGGPGESVLEPRWDADGTLYFLSDRSGWWNLYRCRDGRIEAVTSLEAEIGGPLWTLGESSYALLGDGRAVVRCTRNARDRLGVVEVDGTLRFLDLPFVALSSIEALDASTVIAVAAAATTEPAVVIVDIATGGHRVLRAPGTLRVDPSYISVAEPIEYPTVGGRTAHAFYYPPVNPEFLPLEGERPPLVVKTHGGPTGHSGSQLNLGTQFWTTRGFAVLDVNYGGSTGYGRAYRERLDGNWGIVDVADVVAGVQHLVATGRADGARTAIRGGSAGGFTVLAALAFHDVFRAGADYYGVSDLEALARDTHKFESRYLDRLVAPLPAGKAIYEARAPIRHLESFHAPLIVFQGAEDAVVPPSQSRAIVAALERKGVPVVYMELEGEQHGFRKAESIVSTLEAELAFYGRVFGLL